MRSEQVSPELALVDPVLAAHLRAVLHAPGEFRPASTVAEGDLKTLARVENELAPPNDPATLDADGATSAASGTRRHAGLRLGTAAIIAGVGTTAAALALGMVGLPALSAQDSQPGSQITHQPEFGVDHLQGSSAGAPTGNAPVSGQRLHLVRIVSWAPVMEATSYEAQLYRGSQRVFRARSTAANITLRSPWVRGASAHWLHSGTYDLYVWPVKGGRLLRDPIVRAKIELDPD